MALVGISYHWGAKLFFIFHKIKTPSIFAVRSKVSSIIPASVAKRQHHNLAIVNPCCSVIISCSITRALADHGLLVSPLDDVWTLDSLLCYNRRPWFRLIGRAASSPGAGLLLSSAILAVSSSNQQRADLAVPWKHHSTIISQLVLLGLVEVHAYIRARHISILF